MSTARIFAVPAAVFWLVVLLAALDVTRGNPTAINAVIGAGIGALVFTGLAWDARRESRR
jgi:hypothetical protein